MGIKSDMRERELQYAEERKKAQELNEQILEKRAEFQRAFEGAIEERKKTVKKKYTGVHFNPYNRPDKDDYTEINSGEIMVETSGYIPLREQVMRFERAGISLKEEMAKLYDFSPRDDNHDGFQDDIIQQYPDNIEGFEIVQNAQMKALQELIKEKNNVSIPEPEPEPEPEPNPEPEPEPEPTEGD